MSKHNPKVSVIIATYNRARMLKEAIQSVLNQTFGDFELIIINDGSRDATRKVTLSFNDPRIIYIKKKHEGVASARNAGLSNAKGKYISYLDDDDIYYPQHLNVLARFLDRHREIGLVYGDVHFKTRGKALILHSFDFSKQRLELDNFIPINSLMHRKKCLKKTMFFDQTLPFAEDWDMVLKMSDKYPFSHLKKIVAQGRFYKKGLNSTLRYDSRLYIDFIKKRLLFNKGKAPFGGYYIGITYRLIYKFKAQKKICVSFIKRFANLDKRNPETWLSLCVLYLVDGDPNKAVVIGRKALSILVQREDVMGDFKRECVFNINRVIARALKEMGDLRGARIELKNAIRFAERRVDVSSSLTAYVSKILNRLAYA